MTVENSSEIAVRFPFLQIYKLNLLFPKFYGIILFKSVDCF